jgi:hypothetical protein
MAGIVVFKSGDWDISSGGFRAMAMGVSQHLALNQAASAVRDSLALAVESQLYFLDVTDSFTGDMLREFKKALESHIAEASVMETRLLDNPELHKGYLSKLNELCGKIGETLAT